MTSSFGEKKLRVTFTLGQGQNAFAGTGGNQLILTGLRTLATIGGAFNLLTQLDLVIYGMKADDMNALSVIRGVPGFPSSMNQNNVLLEGSVNAGQTWFTLFDGQIVEGGPDYRGMPEVFYHCQAMPSVYFPGQTPPEQAYLSYPAGASVATVASAIATLLGGTLDNNGVTATVPKGTYLHGTALDMLDQLIKKSGNAFTFTIDPDNTLVIMPPNQPRTGGVQLVLSPASGLVGYPTIEQMGIGIIALFDPAMLLGNPIVVNGSDIPAANGAWLPYDITYQLEQLAFGGQWFAAMRLQTAP